MRPAAASSRRVGRNQVAKVCGFTRFSRAKSTLSQLFITKIVPLSISTDVEKVWKNRTPPVHGASLGTGCRSGKCLDCPHPLVLVFPSLLETPCVLTLRDSAQ